MQLGVLLLGVLALAPAPPSRALKGDEYQKQADEARWLAPEKEAFKGCLSRYRGAYAIDLVPGGEGRWYGAVRVREGGKEVCSFRGHFGTAFLVRGGVLYYAEFSTYSSGCAVVAHDLKGRKRLWRSELKGLGPIDHSKYFNAVRMEAVDGKALAVYGKESAGRYVEFVDLRTGKTVGHRKFKE